MNPHEILGVNQSATKEEVEKAYRKLAREHHPDRNPGDEQAEIKFKEIQNAYEQITNPKPKFESSFNPFDMFFNQMVVGRNYETILELTMEEFAFGFDKEVEVKEGIKCESCSGTGGDNKSKKACANCKGQGTTIFKTGNITMQSICQSCRGMGHFYDKKCENCQGNTFIPKVRLEKVFSKDGISPEKTIIISGKGEQVDVNSGRSGDLFVRLRKKKHPVFSWREDNITISLDVPVYKFYFGGKIPIKTLRGDRTIVLDPNSSLNKEIVFPKEGVAGSDFIVIMNPILPGKSDENDKIFKLLEIENGNKFSS
jgi:molecular chaperone DnaJ